MRCSARVQQVGMLGDWSPESSSARAYLCRPTERRACGFDCTVAGVDKSVAYAIRIGVVPRIASGASLDAPRLRQFSGVFASVWSLCKWGVMPAKLVTKSPLFGEPDEETLSRMRPGAASVVSLLWSKDSGEYTRPP